MKRLRRLLAIVALGIVLVMGITVGTEFLEMHGPVYTVAQVQQGVRQHSQAWIGRTVLVRAMVGQWGFEQECVPPSACHAVLHFEQLIPPGSPARLLAGTAPTLLVEVPSAPVHDLLFAATHTGIVRALPGPFRAWALGLLLPPRGTALYRLRLLARRDCPPVWRACPDAVLQDLLWW